MAASSSDSSDPIIVPPHQAINSYFKQVADNVSKLTTQQKAKMLDSLLECTGGKFDLYSNIANLLQHTDFGRASINNLDQWDFYQLKEYCTKRKITLPATGSGGKGTFTKKDYYDAIVGHREQAKQDLIALYK